MTIIIASHIRNIIETFTGIFMGIPLGYTAYYYYAMTNAWWKKNYITITNDTVWSTISMSVDGAHAEQRKLLLEKRALQFHHKKT